MCAGMVFQQHDPPKAAQTDSPHPQEFPKAPQGGPRGPKGTPKRPKMIPRAPQRHPKGTPRRPKVTQDTPQEFPKAPKRHPRRHKSTHRETPLYKTPDQPPLRPICYLRYVEINLCIPKLRYLWAASKPFSPQKIAPYSIPHNPAFVCAKLLTKLCRQLCSVTRSGQPLTSTTSLESERT